jgi:hypothetical protein
MATAYDQVLVGDIDITETYKKLMKASTGEDSIYLRAKETLQDLYETTSGLSDTQKATLIGQGIIDIAKDMTSNAMQMALKIDTENRDAAYALTKLKEETRLTTAQVAKVEKDIDLAGKNLWIATVTGWKMQAEAYRDYGIQTWNQLETDMILAQNAYTEYGTKVETLKKAKVDTYATYANSYRQNGKVNYTTNITDGSFATVTAVAEGLTYQQTKVAERQRQGFDDNMRQHVVNSSASMVSMLLATEASGINYTPYLDKWSTAASYLSTNLSVSGGSMSVSSWGILSKSSGITISGSVTNIDAGRTVSVVLTSVATDTVTSVTIYGAVNIVLIDGTFSIVTPGSMFSSMVTGTTYSVKVSLLDNAGNSVIITNSMVAVA